MAAVTKLHRMLALFFPGVLKDDATDKRFSDQLECAKAVAGSAGATLV